MSNKAQFGSILGTALERMGVARAIRSTVAPEYRAATIVQVEIY
jgi:hypothetical protein